MIQQSAASISRDAQKLTSLTDDKHPDRQRGMWSFLTWSFFLAQAVAAHEAFAKGHAAADGDLSDAAAAGADDSAAQKSLAGMPLSGVSGFDIDPAAAAQFAAAIAAGAITPQMWAAFQADPATLQAFMDTLAGHASAAGGAATLGADGYTDATAPGTVAEGPGDSGTNGPGTSGPGTDGPVLGGGPGDGGIHIPGIDLPGGIHIPGIDIHLPIDVAANIGLDDISLHVGDIVNLAVNGEDGIKVDLLGDLLGVQIGGDAGLLGLNVLGHDPLAALLGDDGLLGKIGLTSDLADSPIKTIVTAVPEALEGVGEIAQTVAKVGIETVAGVADVAHDVLGSLLGGLGGLGSQGSIEVAGTASSNVDMYDAGEHTEYGVEIGSASAREAESGSSTADSDSINVVQIVDDVSHDLGNVVGSLLHDAIHELGRVHDA